MRLGSGIGRRGQFLPLLGWGRGTTRRVVEGAASGSVPCGRPLHRVPRSPSPAPQGRNLQADGEAGFALIESIAVLALSGLVLVTLLIATGLVSRNAAAAARRAEQLETLATGLAAARRDLESTDFVPSGADPASPVIFSGTQEGVGVAATTDRSGRGAGGALIWIESRFVDGEGQLIRSSAPLLPSTTSFQDVELTHPVILAEGPWRFRLAYAKKGADDLIWQAAWENEAGLPEAVRIEVLDAAEKRVVPALTVHLAVRTLGCAVRDGGCGGAPAGGGGDGTTEAESNKQTDANGRTTGQ